ncbi:MAG TPA: DNA repair protein RecN [Chloroflexota bacterium]|nr:DNA repair protein RecN [Chloroflexota bacterium]
MLLELTVRNFALLEQATLRWAPGLNVLTGETGAGKSILIDAIGALLGSRLGPDWIRGGAERAYIEGVFAMPAAAPDDALRAALAALDIPPEEDGTLILSRELVRGSGRSLCRVNGRAVLLGALGEIGRCLVDIHGQSEHLSLLRVREQLALLDRYAGTTELRAELATRVAELDAVRAALRRRDEDQRRLAREASLLRHEIAEIEAAAPQPGEVEDLLAQRHRLRNAERLRTLALGAYAALQGGDGDSGAALDALGAAATAVAELAALDRRVSALREALDAALASAEECARDLRRYAEAIESDPAALQAIEERLHTLRELHRKYGGSTEAVLAYLAEARAKLDQLEHHEEHVAELEAREAALVEEVGARAAALSERRQAAARALAVAVERELADLRMAGARFRVQFSHAESERGVPVGGRRLAYDQSGVDRVEFLLAANAGEEPKPLARVASGGELARILLALKTILAEVDVRPTLIFDEVDVGVGGRLGHVLAQKLATLARRHQILCVTHLPQLAAFGDHHVLVSKHERAGRTETMARVLSAAERVEEIAAMLGGTSETARRNASELLARAAAWKRQAAGAA